MNETKSREDRWNRLKVFAGLLVVTFTVTLAAIIGNRLSDESLAVLAGAACGVGAAIPTSLLVVAVSRKRDEQRETLAAPQQAGPVQAVDTQTQILLAEFDVEVDKYGAVAKMLSCHGKHDAARAASDLADRLADNRDRILDLATGQGDRGSALDATMAVMQATTRFIEYGEALNIQLPETIN